MSHQHQRNSRRNRCGAPVSQAAIESLENRRLLSASPEVELLAGSLNVYREGRVVTFTADATDDLTAPLDLTYDWQASLGTRLLEENLDGSSAFDVLLPDQGSLIVTVSVTDGDGHVTTASTLPITVANVAPVINVASTPPAQLFEGDVYTLFMDATDAGPEDVLTYVVGMYKQNSSGVYIHQFNVSGGTGTGGKFINVAAPDEGNWRFTAAVTDGIAADVEHRFTTVLNAAPQPTIIGAPTGDVIPGAEINLTAQPNDPGINDTHTFAWTVTRDGDVIATGSAASITFTADAAGEYEYSVAVTDNALVPAVGSASGGFTAAEPADTAVAVYSGPVFVSTASASSDSAVVALRATLTDLDSIGDITAATVTFYDTFTNQVYAANVPVTAVAGEPGTGIASASYTHTLAGSGAEFLRIGVLVGGGYTADLAQALVTVSRPDAGRIVGGGTIRLGAASAGLLSGENGTVVSFGYHARSNPSTGQLTGAVEFMFSSYQLPDGSTDSTLHTYSIRSTAVTSLDVRTIDGVARAWLGANVDVYDATNPLSPVLIQAGAVLELQTADIGRRGAVAFGLWHPASSSGLLFTNSWAGGQSVLQELESGNTKIWDL